jgi:hypothetical protein
MIHEGFGFLLDEEGQVSRAEHYSNLDDGVLTDAKKQMSRWHVVLPLGGSSSVDKRVIYGERELGDSLGGRTGTSTRGKPRSQQRYRL